MHDPASEVLRIYLPRRWVNKGRKKGRRPCWSRGAGLPDTTSYLDAIIGTR